jgi:hypothetical protein
VLLCPWAAGIARLHSYSWPSDVVARVWLQSTRANSDRPLLAFVRYERGAVFMELPYVLPGDYVYMTAAQTLCPLSVDQTLSVRTCILCIWFIGDYDSIYNTSERVQVL